MAGNGMYMPCMVGNSERKGAAVDERVTNRGSCLYEYEAAPAPASSVDEVSARVRTLAAD